MVIVLAAAALRLWMPGPTIRTTDELNWSSRSREFHAAWERREAGDMTVGHPDRPATRPGVTTMWTGLLAIELADRDAPGFSPDVLRNAHQLMAIWCSLLLAPFIALAALLFRWRTALIAGGLVAVEPLMVGHSALLHTDALLTMAAAVGILALMAAADQRRRERSAPTSVRRWRRRSTWLGALAGAAAGMAVLTKISALVPLVGATVTAVGVHASLTWRSTRSARAVGREVLAVGAVPGIAAAATIIAAWPALWVEPVTNVRASLDSLTLADRAQSRFFLGEVGVGGDWRTYAVEAWFRASPWLLLLTVGALTWKAWAVVTGAERSMRRRDAAVLAGAAGLYLVAICVSEKQYARYLLPLLPLGAIALGATTDRWLRALGPARGSARRRLADGIAWAAFAIAAAMTASLAPYEIAHVNPLVGGQRTAARHIPLGWGEGRERVTAAYQEHPGCPTWHGTGGWVTFCPASRLDASFVDDGSDPPRFVLRYVYDRQRRREHPGLDAYLREHGRLVEAVTIDGVRYAEMWEVVPDP